MKSRKNALEQAIEAAGKYQERDKVLQDRNIIQAVNDGDEELVKTLLNNKDSKGFVNIPDSEGNTAVMWAAFLGNKKILQRLIDVKCDLNIQNKQGETALTLALLNGHTDIAKILIKSKVDVDKQNSEGETAAMIAAAKGYEEIIKKLIKTDANLVLLNKTHNTVLFYARKNKRTSIKNLLIKYFVNKYDKMEAPNLLQLDNKEGIGILELFGEIGTDHHRIAYRWLFLNAAKRGRTDILKTLIEAKVDLNVATLTGDTALMCAAGNGHTESVKALIEAKADLNFAEEDGWTALMFAVQYGHTESVKALIEAKADLNLASKMGATALIFAAQNCHTESVKALIEAKADLNFASKYGETALICAAKNGHTESVKALIEAKVDLNFADEDGWTALMNAARGGFTESVKALIEAKAGLNFADKDGWTALMFAAQNGHINSLKILIQAGAQLEKTDTKGNSALDEAIKGETLSAVRALLEAGAMVKHPKLLRYFLLNSDQRDPDVYLSLKELCKQEKSRQATPAASSGLSANEFKEISLYTDKLKKLHELYEKSVVDKMEEFKFPSAIAKHVLIEKYYDSSLLDNLKTPFKPSEIDTVIVKSLIALKADLDSKDADGKTALFYASVNKQTDIVKLLLDNGATPLPPLESINSAQKYIIDATINDCLDDIGKFAPKEAINGFVAILVEKLTENEIKTFQQQDILDSVEFIRKILNHPCPQNRTESYSSFGASQNPNMVVYPDENHKAAFEQQGLLGLTPRNDKTALPITKEAVVAYITQRVKERIYEKQNIQTASLSDQGMFASNNQSTQDDAKQEEKKHNVRKS